MLKLIIILAFLPITSFADIYKCNKSTGSYLSSEPCDAGALVVQTHKYESSQVRKISFKRGVDDNFFIKGSVNGMPVSLIVDTGATQSTISGRLARQLGMNNCEKVAVAGTANGDADVCYFKAKSFSFGIWTFKDVNLAVLPNWNGEGLIGNNLLHFFRVEIENDVMYH